MAYFGCHDWQSWCAAAQLGIPEPGHVLFAKIDTGESLHFSGAWRDSEGYVTCSRNLDRAGEDPDGDPQAGVERRSDEDMLSILLGWCEDDMLRELGADWTLYGTDLPWQIIADEAFALAAQLGVTVAWAVTVTSGEYEDVTTTVAAVYDRAADAIAHARAARLYEDARDEEVLDDPRIWRVAWLLRRTTLPAHLVPFATGAAVPPVRPRRMPAQDSAAPWPWQVTVPGRGAVRFAGWDAAPAAAAFLSTLPKAKLTTQERSHVSDFCFLLDVRQDGAAVSWARDRAWSMLPAGSRSTAQAVGDDALGLARDVAAAFSRLE